MKKIILYTGCGIVIIFGIIFFFSCGGGNNKKAIEEVLIKDQWDGYKTIAEKYEYMSKINLTECPTDFRQKYMAHINAWGELAIVEHEANVFKESYDSWSAYLEAFLRGAIFDFGMPGEMNEAQKELRNHYFRAIKMRKDTWHEVLACAAEYGVDTSKY